ncbi:hypothetical protein PHJA_001479900, partial [Phtheirospermum japonicum]
SQQPAVYNINKNDFRDVVQKLTGSPAHERLPTPPPPAVTHPRPPSSRLQRIRPPPLAQINNRPNQITQIHPHPQSDAGNGGPRPDSLPPQNEFGQRPPPPPLSPMRPAAESPISAYMRYLQNSAPSPMWNGGAPSLQPAESPVSAYMRFLQSSGGVGPPPPHPPFAAPSQPQPQPLTPSGAFPSPFAAMPLSPLPFGCIPSPRSPYGMMSPGFLFSPMGQLGLPPLSPTFPVLSPRWRGM